MKRLVLAFFLICALPAMAALPAQKPAAQKPAAAKPAESKAPVALDSGAPVEISAKHSLEWNRKDKTYTAREDAIAKQGAFEVHARTLTAHYDDEKGTTAISQLVAAGSVTIISPPYTAYGDQAVYNVDTGNAVLTGEGLRIATPAETLTAREKIEFFGRENRAVASGGAIARRATDTLSADTMEAFFQKDAAGKTALQKITATGNVTIRTAKETVTGSRGLYDATAGKAVLTGTVRIKQGENWLEGTRAVVDLKTGISQLFGNGNAATEGRVKGLFYPKKQTP